MKTIDIPESVIEIGYSAFKDCVGLRKIKLPFRITKIESEVFANCTSLSEISIPENVEKIDMHAFGNCSSLRKVKFSDGIQKLRVADAAFTGCANLKEIILPRAIADSVLNTKVDYRFDSKKLRELPGLKITYAE